MRVDFQTNSSPYLGIDTTTATNSTTSLPQTRYYQSPPRSVSILVYKTINSVYKSSRKIIVRVCEVASTKKVKPFKMFNLYSTMNRRNAADEKDQPKELETTGHDRFCQIRPSRSSYRKKRKRNVRRAQSAAEFDPRALSAANKRTLFTGRSVSSEQENSESEQTEKSPLVSAKLETFAKMLFNRANSSSQDSTGGSGGGNGSGGMGGTQKESSSSPTRNNLKFQYSALDPGMTATERTPRERATRERSYISCQEWTEKSAGRYEIMAHLEEIGCRPNKNWFLLSDTTVRTDRLMTLIPLPADCIALEELSPSDSPKGVLMELLGSLQHPYVYPVLDLGIFYSNQTHYACLVMPFNARGSLKDLIYKSQWNDPWNRKYTRKSTCLPLSQVQRLGRQILEALLFLRERGFPSHGHLHSGNVILQNGVARLSGLENGLLGLNSKVNAVVWATNIVDVENMDIICFGHLLFEMCTGYELPSPRPTAGHLQLDLERYPQVVEVLQMIFESPDNRYPTVEELVLCDLFRNIDLREMRGPSISSFKHGLSMSTLNLLNAVRRRQGASLNGSYSEGSSPCTPPSTPRRIGLRDVNSFDISSDSEDVLDEVVITASSSEFHQFHGFLHPSISSPIAFFDNSMHSMESMPSTSANVGGATTAPTTTSSLSISNEITNENLTIPCCSSVTISPSTFSNQLTTDLCTTSKNSKSRRMEYSMRGTKTCSSSSSCNPSQDSAFGSMTDGELSIASNSCRMSSFQSMSSPIDESVEDSITGLPGPSLTSSLSRASTTSNNESIDVPDYNPTQMAVASSASDFNLLKKKSASFGTTSSSGLPIEPPTILVNDGNSFYTTSPAKTFDTIQVFSQKYRVSSFEDMSMKRNFLRNVHKQNFRSLEEERRIDSAFTPVVKTMHSHHRSFDAGHRNINNSEKFKKLTHVSFASKISTTRERHTVWKNSILARKNNLIKSNESLHDYSGSSGSNSGSPKTAQQNECFYDTKLRKRVNSTNELCSTYRNDVEGRFSALTDDLKLFTQKSCSERYLLNMTMLRQTTISNDCDECDEDESNGAHRSENESCMDETCSNSSNSGYGHITLTNSSTNSKTENNSTDSSPSHRSMCKIIGGIESDNRHIEEKIPLLDGMEMSPISPVENNDML